MREVGRSAGGVRSIKLAAGDSVVGAVATSEEETIVIATADGKAKRVPATDFPEQGRAGAGVRALRSAASGPKVVGVAGDGAGYAIGGTEESTTIRAADQACGSRVGHIRGRGVGQGSRVRLRPPGCRPERRRTAVPDTLAGRLTLAGVGEGLALPRTWLAGRCRPTPPTTRPPSRDVADRRGPSCLREVRPPQSPSARSKRCGAATIDWLMVLMSSRSSGVFSTSRARTQTRVPAPGRDRASSRSTACSPSGSERHHLRRRRAPRRHSVAGTRAAAFPHSGAHGIEIGHVSSSGSKQGQAIARALLGHGHGLSFEALVESVRPILSAISRLLEPPNGASGLKPMPLMST